jgi:hypothetical protein
MAAAQQDPPLSTLLVVPAPLLSPKKATFEENIAQEKRLILGLKKVTNVNKTAWYWSYFKECDGIKALEAEAYYGDDEENLPDGLSKIQMGLVPKIEYICNLCFEAPLTSLKKLHSACRTTECFKPWPASDRATQNATTRPS